MSNDEGGRGILLGHGVQRVLHDPLTLRVEGGGGLVEEKDLRPPDDRPRDADALALTTRQLSARDPGACVRLVTVGQRQDELVGVGLLCRRLDLSTSHFAR